MKSVRSVRPIGSFFESAPEFLVAAAAPPWEKVESVQYVQTGRQALSVLAAILEKEGRDTLLVPSYLCDSMIVSFTDSHWILRSYAVSEQVEISAEDLLRVAEQCDPARTAALTIAYFGKEPSAAHIQAVKQLQACGIRVIEDETHRLLGQLDPLGDFGIASLRKVLPVADGAYVRGVDHEIALIDRSHSGWEAMDLKRAGAIEEARSVFASASAVLEAADSLTPARATARTMKVIHELDYHRLRARRRANGLELRRRLRRNGHVRIVASADLPSHLVIQVDDARRVQAELANRSIFCPIHWPVPGRMADVDWLDGLLSLPIDHRYGPDDMARVDNVLAEVLS